MSDTKKSTKLAAVAASLALAASAGGYTASIYSTAHAEEAPVASSPAATGDTAHCDTCDKDYTVDELVHEDLGEGAWRECCPVCGTEVLAACPPDTAAESYQASNIDGQDSFAVAGETSDENKSREAEEPPSTPVAKTDIKFSSKPTIATSASDIALGGDVIYSMSVASPTGDPVAQNGLDRLQLSMTSPTDMEVQEVRVYEGASLVYSSKRADMSDNRGTLNGGNGSDYVFTFSDEYMSGAAKPIHEDVDGNGVIDDRDQQAGMSYSGTLYRMELITKAPSNTETLKKYQDENGNATISQTMNASVTTRNVGATATDTLSADPYNATVTIRMPQLNVIKQVSADTSQVLGEIVYTLTITTNNADAKGLKVVDEQIDPLHALGIDPTKISLTKNGVPLSSPAWELKNGNLEFSLGSTPLSTSDTLKLQYTIVAGTDDMKQNKGELQKLLDMDMNNQSGERRTTVTAENAFAPAVANTYFNLLIPAVSSTSKVSREEISTGERSTATIVFHAGGESGAAVIAPKINVGTPAFGHIENIRVDGQPYTSNTPLPDKPNGSDITLTYDIVAPTDYKPEYSAGITVGASLSADNLVENCDKSAFVKVAIPELGAAVAVSDQTPSAEDQTETIHPVHVVSKFRETSGKSKATGLQFVLTDKPANEGDDPVEKRFENLRVNGVEPAAGTYLIDYANGVTTISCDELAAGQEIVIEYDNIVKKGTEPNGKGVAISARVQKTQNASVVSNFPDGGEKTALTDFTVQIPELHIAKQITAPVLVDEESGESTPEVINVGDTVSYKTTFFENNEEMPAALGRDFKLVEKIEDLFISNESKSDQKVNEKAAQELPDERDVSTKVSDTIANGRTYKASQLGITFCPVEEMKLLAGEEDVTDNFDISLNETASELTVVAKEGKSADLTKVPTAIEFSVKMGKAEDGNNYDQLAGKDIKVSSALSVSNLEKPVTAVSSSKIADAELYITKTAAAKDIEHGDTTQYTITAINDKDDKFDDESVARNVKIEDDLDKAAADFGYRINPASLKVMLGGKDITSTSDVVVLWDTDATGFDLALSKDLDKKDELVITYDTITAHIEQAAYSQSLGSVSIATADNAKPAVAFENVLYHGQDLPLDETGQPGSMGQDGSGAIGENANGSLVATGDIVPYIIAGVIAVAVIGTVVVLVVRRREK